MRIKHPYGFRLRRRLTPSGPSLNFSSQKIFGTKTVSNWFIQNLWFPPVNWRASPSMAHSLGAPIKRSLSRKNTSPLRMESFFSKVVCGLAPVLGLRRFCNRSYESILGGLAPFRSNGIQVLSAACCIIVFAFARPFLSFCVAAS